MSRMPLWTRCQLVLVALFWAHIGASAYFIPLGGYEYGFLLPRTSDCASGYSACSGSNLPSNFCCTSGATCEVLAGNTTIVCCPSGEDCDTIYPISCNLTEQNADLYPKSGVKTTALTGTLESCGSSTCCPFGYSCSSDVCTMDADQSEAPATTSSVSTATTTSTSASTSTSTSAATVSTTSTGATTSTSTAAEIPTVVVVTTIKSTTATKTTAVTTIASSVSTGSAGAAAADSTSTAASSSSASSTSSGSKTKTSSIVGGVVGGVAGLLLIGAAVWFFMGYRVRRRNQPKTEKPEPSNAKLNRSTSSFGNIINNPLPISSPKLQSCTTFRSDFIRKIPGMPPSNTPPSTVNAMVPVPPIENISREPRGESPIPGNQQPGRQDTAAVRPIRGMRNSPPPWQRQQSPVPPPPPQRQSESAGEEINVGVDPSIMAHSGLNVGIYQSPPPQPPPAIRDPNNNGPQKQPSNERLTTFTTMMKEADLNLERYVADTPHSSPETGRK